jgi:transcriptional regulator with XRE-family HTH domain
MERGGRQFPNRLRKYRRIHGYKQKEVNLLLGIEGQSRVSRWERGESLPDVINLFKLCHLYNTLPNELYFEVYKKLQPGMTRRKTLFTSNKVK